jgi:hypothetical protein
MAFTKMKRDRVAKYRATEAEANVSINGQQYWKTALLELKTGRFWGQSTQAVLDFGEKSGRFRNTRTQTDDQPLVRKLFA